VRTAELKLKPYFFVFHDTFKLSVTEPGSSGDMLLLEIFFDTDYVE
jgi:hypothetical protein